MSLRNDIRTAINCASRENATNTPDFVLAEYLINCLNAFDQAIVRRAQWYGRMDVPGHGSMPYANPYAVDNDEDAVCTEPAG